ncbi:MAG: N-acetylmuramic acid 6-phosphate etherase [Planctomycetes bacterium]|nr:N-acetylmuramic acid 6-phosphate etherase [Planctomycetota bacterium]
MAEDFATLGTESQSNGKPLDLLTTEELLRAINAEDKLVANAVAASLASLSKVVDAAVLRLRAGGRLHYFGAGTSGRLGVLDASEVPPTFGVDASVVQGHMAGGADALRNAVEGAEDSNEFGQRDVEQARIEANDVVVALSASGRTPYALGVLQAAAQRGALTVAMVCNSGSPMERVAQHCICVLTGPEILSGSTRMKAGTAQKLVLNMLSTALMVRLGRTHGALMVGVQATNEKLRARALRIVQTISAAPQADCEAALEAAAGDARVATLMVSRSLDAQAARKRLEACDGSLRAALNLHA